MFLLNVRCFTHPQDTVYVIRCFSTNYNVVATAERRMVRWAMGVSPLEHWRNEEILEEARVESIVMIKRRLEWFGRVKRRHETENIRPVVEMKIKTKGPRGRRKLQWKDTVRRDLNDRNIREEWATDRERWKGLCKTRYPAQGDGGERWGTLLSRRWAVVVWKSSNRLDMWSRGACVLIFRPSVIVSDKQAKTSLTCYI